MRLADLQWDIAAAMVIGTAPACSPLLVGGTAPTRRFAIHSRHYAASVARSIVERFAATVWLVGSDPIVRAAAAFVADDPPTGPCMAEYGDTFPAFLESRFDDRLPPFVGQFAAIDWHLGRVAIAGDAPAVPSLAHCDPAHIGETRLRLQDGLAYVRVDWSLDELFSFYLSGESPDSYQLRRESVWLELRGSRGVLSLQRLASGEFTFRAALANGSTLGEAATTALDLDHAFNPIDAVPRLLGEGLVTSVRGTDSEA